MTSLARRRFLGVNLVGLVIVGIASGFITGEASRQRAYVTQQLRAHWKAPWQIVVLPSGVSASSGLVDPDQEDMGTGGISLAEWRTVLHTAGVAVAAPLAPVGVVQMGVAAGPPPAQPGFYAFDESTTGDSALPRLATPALSGAAYLFGPNAPVVAPNTNLMGLIMAIDPTQEARLVGLEKAVTVGRYFDAADNQAIPISGGGAQPGVPGAYLPVLVSTVPPSGETHVFELSRLTVPASTPKNKPLSDGSKYPSTPVVSFTWSDSQVWELWQRALRSGKQNLTLGPFPVTTNITYSANWILHPGSLKTERTTSPFPSRWPVAFDALPVGHGCTPLPPAHASDCKYLNGVVWNEEAFRPTTLGYATYQLNAVGFYDPSKLKVAVDPLTHLPLVGYRPPQGTLVLSASGKAFNPERKVLPGDSPVGLFTEPPVALTTLSAAAPLLGPKPISSIRVTVSGGAGFSSSSEARVESVAAAIRKETGLTVQVVQGASPEEVLIHPVSGRGYTTTGWIQEAWLRLGAGLEILRQAILSQDVILVPVLWSALLFALAIGVIGVEVRRKEYATLLAIGVQGSTVRHQIVEEGLLYGGIALVLTVATALVVGGVQAVVTALPVALAAGFVIAAALYPTAVATSRMQPLEGLRTKLPTFRRFLAPLTPLGLGLSFLASGIRRDIYAAVSMLVPAALVEIIVTVNTVVHGSFHLTTLGQYLLVKVGPLIEAGAVVSVILAVLVATVVGVRQVLDRQATWSLGKALGWRGTVALASTATEAALTGMASGLVGASAGYLVAQDIFGVHPSTTVWVLTVLGIAAVCVLASIPSVFILLRSEPLTHLRGEAT